MKLNKRILSAILAAAMTVPLAVSCGGDGGREEPEKEAVLNHMVIEQLLGLLEERERRLIRLRYFEGKTQSETAAAMGMTQVQVSRTEKKILLRLRENLS